MNGQECKDTNDCKNGAVCTMTYADENKTTPLGRFCRDGKEPEDKIITCRVNSDCPEGDCKVIKDRSNRFIGRQCTRMDGSSVRECDVKDKMDSIDGDKYQNMKKTDVLRIDSMVEDAKGGPVARMIAEIITLVFAVIDKAIFIARNVFWGVFTAIGGPLLQVKGDLSILMLDVITDREYPNDNPEKLKKCKETNSCSRCYSLWLLRNIFTILIPPYGVMMTTGIYGTEPLRKIVISCILTGMFYFPGLVYSLIIVNSNKLAEEERKLTKCKNERKVINNTYSIEKVQQLARDVKDPNKPVTSLFN